MSKVNKGPAAPEKLFVRSEFNYDMKAASDAGGLACRDASRTSQEFKDEVDINTIAKRYGLTGELPENVPMVFHGDFTDVVDFRGAHDLIVRARESFDALPAHVRSRFDNDAAKFVDFTSDAKNFDEAVSLGLVRPEVQEARAKEAQAKRQAEIEAAAAELVKMQQAASGEAVGAPGKKGAKDQSST